MPEFRDQAKNVTWHIPFPFSKEMAKKSSVVSGDKVVSNVG